MEIRKADISELEEILGIYAAARRFMAENGNYEQWKGSYPPEDIVREDICRERLYLCIDGEIAGVFMFMTEPEPTYSEIDGEWLDDKPYGTIHRVASSGAHRGLMMDITGFCFSRIPNLKIDTHEKNLPMQRALEKCGFVKCGTVRLSDGSLRLAYQKNKGV